MKKQIDKYNDMMKRGIKENGTIRPEDWMISCLCSIAESLAIIADNLNAADK